MRSFVIAAAVLLAACSQQPPAHEAPLTSVENVIAAERAFAADAAKAGWVEAFLAHSADDAIVLQPGPTNAHDFFENIDPGNLHDTSLTWAPVYAGASRAGDLGFTTGPFSGDGAAFGYYFTVWQRQADGSLKWIYDGGVDNPGPLGVDPASSVAVVPQADGGELTAAQATEAVNAAEAALASEAATDVRVAYAAHLSAGAHVHRVNEAPAVGPADADTLLSTGPGSVALKQVRAVVAESGDMAFTVGEARWAGGSGYYTRMWAQQDGEGWRLVFDQIILRELPAVD
jgi:ketosteroid isomerase-like protein